jgi:hypothetical protein
MGNMVLIAENTYKEGSNNIGDFVDAFDDRVELGDDTYKDFNVVHIEGLTGAQIKEKIRALAPEISLAYMTITEGGKWSQTPPDQKNIWNDNGVWKEIIKMPKYPVNFGKLAESDLTNLSESIATSSAKLLLLESKAEVNMTTLSVNQVEMVDLNK